MNIQDINSSIEYLKESDTTFENCQKLASLLVIKEHYASMKNEVSEELQDILPQYKRYVELKKKYQRSEINEIPVKIAMKKVCEEIFEFIQTLYQCTDMPEERQEIVKLTEKLAKTGR